MCAVVVVTSIVLLFYFHQEHFQVCPKYPQTCEKDGKENIARYKVNCFSQCFLSSEVSY